MAMPPKRVPSRCHSVRWSARQPICRRLSGLIVSLLCILCLSGCGEPIVVLPGGELGGSVTPVPAAWRDVPDTVQLETRPADPYSVNIWAVGLDSDLYIGTSVEGTRWSGYMDADPAVRIRIGESLYELSAAPVSNVVERERVANAYVAKYAINPAEWVSDAKLYHLTPR